MHRALHRESYILLNLLNELMKSDKMRDLLFRELNKFNNKRTRIYHMTLKLHFGSESIC